jgi:AraC-like DNA-binding protein
MSNISRLVSPFPDCNFTFRLQARRISSEEENSAMYEALNELEMRGKTHLERLAIRTVKPSLVYMLTHLDQPLRVPELSRIADVSCSHFFALFKRATGQTPISYFTRVRMRRACKMLLETSLSVKEIAASLGYEDEFYFSRLFKSVHQLAPSYYRAQCASQLSQFQSSPVALRA